MTVRPARPDEAATLVSMYEWLLEAPGYRPGAWDPQTAERRLAAAIEAADSAVLVADDAGAPVGLCTAYLELDSVRFGRRCWIEDLVVDPARRSRGVGGALLDAAAEWAREQGATHLELDTGLARTDSQRFYERRAPDAVGYSYTWVL